MCYRPSLPFTFGFFPNSHSLFLVLLIGCFGSGRGPGAPSLSLSPFGVLLMVPSEPVLLRFRLKSSKGKSPGGSKPDLNDSTTMIESWEEDRIEREGQKKWRAWRQGDFILHPFDFLTEHPSSSLQHTLRSSTALAAETIPSRHLDTIGMTRRSASAKLRYVSPSFTVRRSSMSCRFWDIEQGKWKSRTKQMILHFW